MKKKILFILSTLVLFTSFSFADEYPDHILPPYQKVTEVMDSKNFCDVYISEDGGETFKFLQKIKMLNFNVLFC